MAGRLEYYDENIPCLAACPVHTNAGMYVAAIADGRDELAYLTARLPNPFASVCGRVCAAPCEDACRRGAIDRPIAIRALKRFVTEKYGPENDAGGARAWDRVAAAPEADRSTRVAIVGGGPAGLAAAHDLRRHGHRVTIYEANEKLGGAMWLGIPEYRLDRTVLQRDIDAILELGIDVHYDTRLGRDITLGALRQDFDAVFVGIGASLGRGLDMEGADADGVLKAIEFLVNMNRGFHVDVGERVLVIGGGDVAMDAARTALRADDYDEAAGRDPVSDAIDAARTAARAGARHITVMSLERRDQMPAHEFEVEEAEAEGVSFENGRGPARILVQNGRVTGVETKAVTRLTDDEGRFSPQFDETDLLVIPADTVILAVGQAIDLEVLGPDGPEASPRRTIGVDDLTGATSLADVWAGGDAAKGPRSLIDAIADGRRSAADIHRALGGDADDGPEAGQMVTLRQFHRLDDVYDSYDRIDPPTLDTGRRIGLREVELGFDELSARAEAARCLRCFANIQLDVEKCVLCALCADVCPVDVISLVPAIEVDDTAPAGATALLLDESRCIRCALCIERCPPDALSMGVWTGTGVPACQ